MNDMRKEFSPLIDKLNTIGKQDNLTQLQRDELAAIMLKISASQANWLPQWAWELPSDETVRTIYQAENNGPFINIISWCYGCKGYIHNHNTWGMVSFLQGCEENITWDHNTTDNSKNLSIKHKQICKPGSILNIEYNDIHSVNNITERSNNNGTAISLHVYGANLLHTDRQTFDPHTASASSNKNSEFKNAEFYLLNKEQHAS
jgi:predicted metal-dependent enzyme (double-stranded beta helix superfamily)